MIGYSAVSVSIFTQLRNLMVKVVDKNITLDLLSVRG